MFVPLFPSFPYSLLLCVDASATGWRPALASLSVRMVGLAVIEQYLLARFDVSQSEKKDMAADDFAVAVRFA